MLSQKSVLARLLATENITVQQGNYETAYFDVVNRVLGLPLWKELDKDIYDLLVGHEVSHALFTPSNFFELNDSNIPKSWYNVIEDARIEKLILRKYPGLVANFKRGYARLILEKDIFGLANIDVNSLALIDRLNVLAKGRGAVEINFSEEEKPFVERMMRLETYDDVVTLVSDLAKFTKETRDAGTDKDSNQIDEDSDDVMDSEESDYEEESGEDAEEDAEEEESDEPLEESLTDESFMENRKDLVEDSQDVIYAEGITLKQVEEITIKYDKLASSRKIDIANENAKFKRNPWRYGNIDTSFPDEEYAEFMKETKSVVNLMVKEFEMRKAAYVSRRARDSQRGSLDVNKLHSYKYNDELFKQVTQLADGKNHGMMMLVDYSGSMNKVLPSVLRQLISLMMFCRRVNIPFDVYAFAYNNEEVRPTHNSATHVNISKLSLVQLGHSALNNRKFEESIRALFHRSVKSWCRANCELLGTTPLNESLMAMYHKIKQFRVANKVQVMNFVTLTDGHSDSLRIVEGSDLNGRVTSDKADIKVNLGSDIVTIDGNSRRVSTEATGATVAFLGSIRKMGVNCINFFIASRPKDVKMELSRTVSSSEIPKLTKMIRAEGCAVVNDSLGYNRRFILTQNKALDGEIENVNIDSGMTPASIAKAFNKSNSSKKKSRILTKKFAEIVA